MPRSPNDQTSISLVICFVPLLRIHSVFTVIWPVFPGFSFKLAFSTPQASLTAGLQTVCSRCFTKIKGVYMLSIVARG
ncbi:hypothetical protein EDD85DRAFT_248438 [Armillaria nabsnona]|nr:hypothetical protein EDD85DRAFT_248438 [Armillaria nabsnona]